VGSLAGDATSARRLERKFLAHVGIGPKRLARMFRLQLATRLWDAGKVKGWADLASAAGYSDQAHMVREYRELAGTSPARLAERERRLSDFFKTGTR
jgi:transcriptional regulator GlxA family with amidase domain